jgi:hypothetical protein
MTSTKVPEYTLKKFGGLRNINAGEGFFVEGYNFEIFSTESGGIGFRRMNGNEFLSIYRELGALEYEYYISYGVFETIQNGLKYTIEYVVGATEAKLVRFLGTYTDPCGDYEVLADGFDKDAKNCNGIDFNGKFFFTNGVDAPRTIEIGASPIDVEIDTTDSTARVHYGLGLYVYDNRIWMTSRYGVIGCAFNDETDWASTGDAGAFWKDYTAATAVHGFSNGLVIMGKYFTEYMSGSGALSYSFEPVGNTGAVGHKAICSHDNRVFFFNGEGVYPIIYQDTNQRSIKSRISNNITETLLDIDTDQYADIQLISLAPLGEDKIWFLARHKSYSTYSVILVYDYGFGEWFMRISPVSINYLSINNNYLYSAGGGLLKDNTGSIFEADSDIEYPINARALTSFYDYGSPAQIKKIKERYLLLTPFVEQNFTWKDIFNGDSSDSESFEVTEDYSETLCWSDSSVLFGQGNGVWDTNSWAANEVNFLKIERPKKKFRMIQHEIICDDTKKGLNQNFSIEMIVNRKIKIKH